MRGPERKAASFDRRWPAATLRAVLRCWCAVLRVVIAVVALGSLVDVALAQRVQFPTTSPSNPFATSAPPTFTPNTVRLRSERRRT
ncbi:MAG: hypothetical protein QM775_06700 [Pirellulales bacterium]